MPHTAAMVVVTCYILFDWGDESIPRKPTLVRNLLRQAHMLQLFLGGRTHTYDYLRMDRGSFFNLARMLRNVGSLREASCVYGTTTCNVPSYPSTQCQE